MSSFFKKLSNIFNKMFASKPQVPINTSTKTEPEVLKPLPEVVVQKPEDKPMPEVIKKKYLALIVGHSKADKGAVGVAPLDQQEYDYNKEIAEISKSEGVKANVVVDIFYRDAAGVVGAYKSATGWLDKNGGGSIIELHFNAANNKAIGTEVLYADVKDNKGVNEKEFAQCILDSICAVFLRDAKGNRGLKRETGAKGERGYSNLSQTVKYPSIIVEPFFGDVTSEAEMALSKKNSYAVSLIKGYLKYLKV